jgi:hypothetical protein
MNENWEIILQIYIITYKILYIPFTDKFPWFIIYFKLFYKLSDLFREY